MGTDVHLMAVGDAGDEALEAARRRIEDLEQRWSRFLPVTELAHVNAMAGGGQPCAVSAVTFVVIEQAAAWWRRTGGLFDPTVLPALVAAGYDRSFELGPGPAAALDAARPAPGCDDVILDRERMTVVLPAGVAIDLGGIGKGAAADLVSDQLEDTPGIAGGCVNLGGDLRVWGASPSGEGWPVGVDGPTDAGGDHVLGLLDGAVATSSIARRTWVGAGGSTAHHLIDPRTGRPAETDIVQATVIASDVVTAEVLAKTAVLAGAAAGTALLERHDVAACITRRDGSTLDLGGYATYRW
jgi:thiamine biosynthesis lipoprotein